MTVLYTPKYSHCKCYDRTSNFTGRLGVVPCSIRPTRTNRGAPEVEAKVTGEV